MMSLSVTNIPLKSVRSLFQHIALYVQKYNNETKTPPLFTRFYKRKPMPMSRISLINNDELRLDETKRDSQNEFILIM